MRSPSRSPCRETRCRATDGSPRRGCRRNVHRRGADRGRRAADGQGANRGAPGGVGAGGGGGRRRRRARAVHARDDGRDERAAGAEGRADGVRGDRGLRAPPAPAAARTGRTSTGSASAIPSPWCRSSAATASASGSGRTASSSRSTSAPPRSTPRRSPSACCSPSGIRATSAPCRRDLPAAPRRTSSPRTRSRPSSGVRAGLDDGGGCVPRPAARQLPARARRPLRRGGAAAAARDALLGRRRVAGGSSRACLLGAAVRARRRGGRCSADRGARRFLRRDRLRHGRDVDGRLSDLRRRGRALDRAHDRGFPIRLPSVDVHTVGAGGGSIAWVDEGGSLRVGPESAGAEPGPACYGSGGLEPTVTDANLLLGRIPDGSPTASSSIAPQPSGPRGLDPADVVEVVNAEMLRALRVVSVERGRDPRGLALVAFGGAGPLHACDLADGLGITTVLVPEAAGALGLGLAVGESGGTTFGARCGRSTTSATSRPRGSRSALPGQSFELTVPLGPGLADRFHELHEERYGYADRARPLELVAVRTAEVRPGPPLAAGPPARDRRRPGDGRARRRHVLGPPGGVGARDGGIWRLTRA